MAQLTYSTHQAVGIEGARADTADYFAISAYVPEGGDPVPFGRGVVLADIPASQGPQGATPIELPSEAGQVLWGVVLHDHAHESGAVGPGEQDSCSVLRRGRVYVRVEDAVTQASPVYVRHTAGGGFAPGSFRGSTDANADLVAGASFAGAAAAGGIVALDLNLPAGLQVVEPAP